MYIIYNIAGNGCYGNMLGYYGNMLGYYGNLIGDGVNKRQTATGGQDWQNGVADRTAPRTDFYPFIKAISLYTLQLGQKKW